MAFAADNHLLAVSGLQGKLTVWDASASRYVGEATVAGNIAGLLSPDGRFLVGYPVLGRSPQLSVWELPRGKTTSEDLKTSAVFPLQGIPNQLAFAADSRLLAVSQKNPDAGQGKLGQTFVEIWNIPEGKKIRSWPGLSGSQLAFSPDGAILAVMIVDRQAAERQVKLFDVAGGEEIFTWSIQARDLSFTADGSLLAATMVSANPQEAGSSVQFLDLASLRRSLAEMKLDWGP